ncbi:hypothetical protein JCM5296_005604 [Sporobolomyces johnsonii]
MSSSRVTYVVLVDAGSSNPPPSLALPPLLPSESNQTLTRVRFAALTFLLFTSIFHHHLTTYTHLLSTSFLCQSFSSLLPASSPVPPPTAHLCALASTALAAPPSPLASFLLVNPRPEVLSLGVRGEGYARAAEMVRELRNWRVGLVVLVKAALVAAVLGALTTTTITTRKVRSRSRRARAVVRVEEEEEKGCLLLPTSSAILVASSSSLLPPPAYDYDYDEGELVEEEVGEEEGDDTPWIALALSLLVHLSIALLDRGAAGAVRATVERTELDLGVHAWAVVAAGVGAVGCGIAWAWRALKRGRVQLVKPSEDARYVVVSM